MHATGKIGLPSLKIIISSSLKKGETGNNGEKLLQNVLGRLPGIYLLGLSTLDGRHADYTISGQLITNMKNYYKTYALDETRTSN